MTPFSEWKITRRPAGTKSEHTVGMPTPRLTIHPSWNSAATRAAIRSRLSRCFVTLHAPSRLARELDAAQDVEDARGRRWDRHQPVDEDTGCVYLVRVELAFGDDRLLDLGDGTARCGRHDRVVVALCPT